MTIRFLSVSLLAAAALTAVSCGSASSGHVFARADLPALVAPKPPLPTKTPWIDVTTSDGDDRAVGFEGFLDPGPLLDELRKTDFQFGYHRVWSANAREPYDYRTEEAYGFLFRTASGAQAALAAFRHHMPKFFPKGRLLRAGELRGGSFGIDSSRRHEPGTFYFWRAGNVVLFANAYCDVACRFERVRQVARAYADTLDANAKRKT